MFFVFKNADHLTQISTTQFTNGIRSKIICTKRLCLLNHVAIINLHIGDLPTFFYCDYTIIVVFNCKDFIREI